MKARNHDVVLSSLRDTEGFARAAGLPFVPLCEAEYPGGSLSKIVEPLRRLQGQEATEYTFQLLADILQKELIDLPRVLTACKADAVILDEADPYLALVPIHLGMPYANISNALPFDFSGNTPLCLFDWKHDSTPAGRVRNLEGLHMAEPAFAPRRVHGRAYAERVGLDIDWADPFPTISKLAWLTQMPREFDFQDASWPSQFHYTGPFHDGMGRVQPDFPWDRLTGEPIIYASMGTIQNGLESVFSAIAEAVGNRAGKQLVLSIGPFLDCKKITSLPANCIVVSSAPQLELLKQSALCITHAGLNTALECLAAGVPMVAIPVTNDQPGVAARIASSKTGAFVPLSQLTVSRLRSLIDEVLENPDYRHSAGVIEQAIAKTDGLETACDLLEEAFHAPGVRRV
jgi:MGT family glycosyltransferase